MRGGRPGLVNIYDIVVGDILLLEPGDVVPVDGILADGNNVTCDESSLTGETHTLRKVSATNALENTTPPTPFSGKYDPFIFSGSKVVEGIGRCVVTSVGKNSCYGRLMECIP